MESTRHANIHVIGDSCVADVMPKSGYSANTQAKVVAAQILHLLHDEAPEEPTWSNVCFSRVSSDYGASVGGIYRLDHDSGKIISTKGSGGVSRWILHTNSTVWKRFIKNRGWRFLWQTPLAKQKEGIPIIQDEYLPPPSPLSKEEPQRVLEGSPHGTWAILLVYGIIFVLTFLYFRFGLFIPAGLIQ